MNTYSEIPAVYLSEKQRLDVLSLCRKDLFFLCKHVLGYVDMCENPHEELCDFLNDPAPRKLLVGARGVYKTTIGTVGKAIQLILQNVNLRILIVSNTDTNAKSIVRQVREQFENNQKLIQLLPGIVPVSKARKQWSDQWLRFDRKLIASEPTVRAAGVDTQLASQHYDWILGDDVVAADKHDMKEGGLMILRPEEIAKAIGWYKLTMRGLAINRKGYQTKVQFIVNRWAVEDFAQYILQNHQQSPSNPAGFLCKIMAVHKPDGKLLWPEVMNETYLQQVRKEQGDYMYWTQYECEPHDPMDKGFAGDAQFYNEPLPLGHEHMNKYMLIDMADTTKPTSCKTAIIVLFVDYLNHIWVVEAVGKKLDVNAKLDYIHKFVTQYKLKRVHIEENLHKETLQYNLRDEMSRRGQYYTVLPLKHKNRNKDARIIRLQPHWEQGAIHIKPNMTELLREFKDFPHTHHKDRIDAIGYIMDIIRRPGMLAQASAPVVKSDRRQITLAEIKASIRGQRPVAYGSVHHRNYDRVAI